jgi:3-hydroxyphenylacetate 6-hydroxylase
MAIGNIISYVSDLALHRPEFLLLWAVIAVPALYLVINEYIRRAARIPDFSGPRGLPLIGNLWQIRANAAEQYRAWSKQYGGVYQIQLGNVPVIVVNTAAAAKAIFGQNAQALSSRPEFYTFHKVSLRGRLQRTHRDSCRGSNSTSRSSRIRLERPLALLHTASL